MAGAYGGRTPQAPALSPLSFTLRCYESTTPATTTATTPKSGSKLLAGLVGAVFRGAGGRGFAESCISAGLRARRTSAASCGSRNLAVAMLPLRCTDLFSRALCSLAVLSGIPGLRRALRGRGFAVPAGMNCALGATSGCCCKASGRIAVARPLQQPQPESDSTVSECNCDAPWCR